MTPPPASSPSAAPTSSAPWSTTPGSTTSTPTTWPDSSTTLSGGRPGATTADPDAAERSFAAIPPMAATFTTMQVDYDSAQGEGRWRSYLGEFFDRTTAGVGRTTADLASLGMPTLLVGGDRDMFCPVEVACSAYRALPAGQLGLVPNTGHDITPQVIDMTLQFLQAHI